MATEAAPLSSSAAAVEPASAMTSPELASAPVAATTPAPVAPAQTQTSAPAATPQPAGPTSSDKLDDAVLEQILKIELLDKDKHKVAFGELARGDEAASRVVVVFIRHFFCGLCQEYIRALMKALPPSKLAALSPPTKLIVIGHGDPSLIDSYARDTGCEYAIYAEPSRKIYNKLGFVSNLAQAKTKPDYLPGSMFANVMSSLVRNLKAGTKMLSGGKISQNGGEMVFEQGKLGYFHRMKDTTDHTEVVDVEKVLSL